LKREVALGLTPLLFSAQSCLRDSREISARQE
jgi:hypothetical protein